MSSESSPRSPGGGADRRKTGSRSPTSDAHSRTKKSPSPEKVSGPRGPGPAVTVAQLLPELLRKLGFDGRNEELLQAWREAAGEEISAVTRVVSLRSAVLTVEVQDAARLHELTVYYQRDFLKLLQQRCRSPIRSLKFRLASKRGADFLEDRAAPPAPYSG